MNKKNLAVLAASYMWVVTAPLHSAPVQTPAPTAKVEVAVIAENPPPMVAKKAEDVKPAVAKDTKITTMLMNKGAGHENWTIKMVSACDQNNVWCVASDGAKEAVFQLTSQGLEHRFDGVFVAAGKGIVTVINAQHEVYELPGGTGKDWKKIEGLKLSKVSRPSMTAGWGLQEKEKGRFTCLVYDEEDQAWEVLKDNEGQIAEGIVDICGNAEESVLALNDKGELLKGDLHRKQMYEKAKEVMKEVAQESKAKGHGKKGKGKKGKGKKGKKAAVGMVDADHDGKDDRDADHDGVVSDSEKAAYDAAHPAAAKKGHGKKGKGKKGKGKKGKKAAAGMVDADHDGKDDRDADHDGKDDRDADHDGVVSDAEKAAYAGAHPAAAKKSHGKKKGKKGKMVDANNDGKDDRDADGDGKVSASERAAYDAAHPAAAKKGKGKKGKKSKMVDADHDGKDDRDADGDGKVSGAEKAAYAASHK